MTRKLAALGMALLLLAGLAACSSKKSSSDPPLNTDKTSPGTTEEEGGPDGTQRERPRLEVLTGGGDDEESEASDLFTDEEAECIEDGAAGDPVLGPLVDEGEEVSTEEEQQALAVIILQCMGQDRVAEAVADAIAADPNTPAYLDISCVEDTLASLAGVDVVLLLIGGAEAGQIAAEVGAACIDLTLLAEQVAGDIYLLSTATDLECVELVLSLADPTLLLAYVGGNADAQQQLVGLANTCP